MKFSELKPALEEGKKIKLSKWKNAYWYLREDGKLMNHFEEEGAPEVRVYELFPRDMFMVARDDWEIVEEDVEEPTVRYFSFSQALEALKDGKKVARKGWNGKGMFLVLCPGSDVDADNMRVKEVKKFYKQEGHTSVKIAPHIDLKAADDTYVTGWVASQTDILADDWFTVE